MSDNLENKENKTGENKEEKSEKFAITKGGLYSKIPKDKKSLRAINIAVVFFGFVVIGLVVLAIALKL